MARSPKRAANSPKEFEEILGRLDTLIEELESDDITLESSLKLFEEGIGLVRTGGQRLDAAEERIKWLMQDGSVREEDDPNEAGNSNEVDR